MAALIGQSLGGTEKARYLALATTLASEKLEDLSRYPVATPPVAPLQGGGSITSDVTGYNDNVDLSDAQGQVGTSMLTTGGGYLNISHQSSGQVSVATNAGSALTSGTGTNVFHRRWLIEQDPAINGVALTGSRRITVLVTMPNQMPPVTFQLSTVRQ